MPKGIAHLDKMRGAHEKTLDYDKLGQERVVHLVPLYRREGVFDTLYSDTLHLLSSCFLVLNYPIVYHDSMSSASKEPIYSTKIKSGHKKQRGEDGSSSNGPVYRSGSFMVFFLPWLKGKGCMEIQVWTQTQRVEIYGSKPTFTNPHIHKNQLDQKRWSTRTGREKMEGTKEIKIYIRIWDGLNGGGGYISK